MTNEEQKIILANILQASQAGDTAHVSELISTLADDYGAVNAALYLASGRVTELSGKVTALQEQNLKLFLKSGDVVVNQEQTQDEDKKPDFKELFDPVTGKLK